jgi:hypothetical protein
VDAFGAVLRVCGVLMEAGMTPILLAPWLTDRDVPRGLDCAYVDVATLGTDLDELFKSILKFLGGLPRFLPRFDDDEEPADVFDGVALFAVLSIRAGVRGSSGSVFSFFFMG